MSNVLKVALSGYNALTDSDPDHFSLYVNNSVDHILIKEKARGSVTVANGVAENIAHGLSGVPFCLVFAEGSSGVWRKVLGEALDGSGFSFKIGTVNLRIYNSSGGTKVFKYYVFYDRVAT